DRSTPARSAITESGAPRDGPQVFVGRIHRGSSPASRFLRDVRRVRAVAAPGRERASQRPGPQRLRLGALELARHHPAPERRLLLARLELGAIAAQVEPLGIARDLLLLQERVLLRLLHELGEPAARARRVVGSLLEMPAVPALDLLLDHAS